MILRPYQSRLIQNVKAAIKKHGNTLGVAATGAGKTIMLAHLNDGKTLVLQHRQELVYQNMDKFLKVNPKASVSVFDSINKSFRGKTVFAMQQSIVRALHGMPHFDRVIVDEVHHIPCPTYQKIIDRAYEVNPELTLLGLTATPERGDGKSLRKYFTNCADQVSIRELVGLGYLVPPKAFVVEVATEALAQVKSTSNFGDQKEVASILNSESINDEVVRNWKEKADGRKTIVFCATVQHAEDVATAFNAAGIKSECVHGNLPDGQRRQALRLFDSGGTQVVTNVAVLTEGYDCLDMNTEVLTPDGWKKHKEISIGNAVYGYDINTGNIQTCSVLDTQSRPVRLDEKMIEIKSQHMNIRVTEGHNLYVRKNRRGIYQRIKAGSLPTWKSEYAIPVSGHQCFDPISLTDDEIRLIAWYITDGYVAKSGRLELYQSEGKHLNHILNLLDRLGYKYWHKARKALHNGYTQTAPIHVIGIGVKQTRGIFQYFDKLIHPYLMNMDERQFSLFWKELLMGDGSRQSTKSGWLWTGRKEVVDRLMHMAIIRGFHTSCAEQKTATGLAYRVSIRMKNEISSLPGDKRSASINITQPVDDETVWCLTNELGTLITRRYGKTAIIGNCQPVSCIVLLRKCSEKGPLIQMVGRGLRIVDPEMYPDIVKTDCVVMDFGSSILTHGNLDQIVDLNEKAASTLEGEAITKICPESYEPGMVYHFPDGNGNIGCGAEIPAQTKVCPICGFVFQRLVADKELFGVELCEVDILNASPFRWNDLFGNDLCLIANGFSAWAGVFSPDHGTTWVAIGYRNEERKIHKLAVTGRAQAMATADDYLRQYETDTSARKSKAWLNDPATQKQVELLNRRFDYGIYMDRMGNSGYTKYSAACHASFQFSRQAIEKILGVA